MAKRRKAPKKAKSVTCRFIPPDSEIGAGLYALLRELVNHHHREVAGARIALAWNLAWKADVDGRVTLGQCKKVSDLEREVAEMLAYDFVVLLRKEFWYDPFTTDLQRRALLDHELCHAAVKFDEHGEPMVDERGRTVYRIRKHDLEEFSEIADRYGCWKRDLEHFAKALDKARHKAKNRWIGYEQLQTELRAAGFAVSLDTIVSWSEEQRREVTVWLELQQAGPALDLLPACLLSGMQAPPAATRETFPPVPPAPGEPPTANA
jgi:hypothetical protein